MILGDTPEHVRELQAEGNLPDPIPDDYFDPIVKFRLDLEKAHERRMRRLQGLPDGDS